MKSRWIGAILAAGLLAFSPVVVTGQDGSEPDQSAPGLAGGTDFSRPEAFEALQGGAATSIEALDEKSFSHSIPGLNDEEFSHFMEGRALFRKIWVSSPSTTRSSDGLGPLYNARSCQACHVNDGRGLPPDIGIDEPTLVLRLAREPANAAEKKLIIDHTVANFPDPIYGEQLQDKAVRGLRAEGEVKVTRTTTTMRLKDGSDVGLARPAYSVAGLSQGALDATTTISPRLPSQIIGLGLVEAIPAEEILKGADPEDQDGDGISGRAQWVMDEEGKVQLGRFGWKGQSANLRQQTAHAFVTDIGISTSLFPKPGGDCTRVQAHCLSLPNGRDDGHEEAGDAVIDLVSSYMRMLAVPARRKSASPEVLGGKHLFYNAGCIACHRPHFVTGDKALPMQLASQSIWPYSDFLLHDMGEGLADGQTAGEANGREWKTPPLWGVGLTRLVAGRSYYLHDGRARTFEEAILWHGGEAEPAREQYRSMTRSDREKLAAFLVSL